MSQTDYQEIIVAKTPGDRTTMHVLYGMHTVAPFTLWTLSVIALIGHYVKRADEQDVLYLAHHNYMIRTVWWTMLWLLVSSPLWALLFLRGRSPGPWSAPGISTVACAAGCASTTIGSPSKSPAMSHSDPNCIFCKIVEGKIPSRKVYEDDEILAFHDIHPWAPVHFLLIPKQHIVSMAHVEAGHGPMMGRLMSLVPRLAQQEGCRPYPEGGFRLVCNTGDDGGQEVRHLHFHVIGGPRPWLKG